MVWICTFSRRSDYISIWRICPSIEIWHLWLLFTFSLLSFCCECGGVVAYPALIKAAFCEITPQCSRRKAEADGFSYSLSSEWSMPRHSSQTDRGQSPFIPLNRHTVHTNMDSLHWLISPHSCQSCRWNEYKKYLQTELWFHFTKKLWCQIKRKWSK